MNNLTSFKGKVFKKSLTAVGSTEPPEVDPPGISDCARVLAVVDQPFSLKR
ncbi:hypothetical protein [Gloeothece verrucosa]|uniref:Uncharacterized protein n=1 Tax=Gloeothece verrucosa (strain PCC 7822) TaxID=497965 RepID=E0U6Z3_GLOV7|nr:hypothetical protein [Gloeothece verrucosa]ADN16030.1 hypothetical protein Cyan7822_4110 [Gloeothece verrucosa PCC 7822]